MIFCTKDSVCNKSQIMRIIKPRIPPPSSAIAKVLSVLSFVLVMICCVCSASHSFLATCTHRLNSDACGRTDSSSSEGSAPKIKHNCNGVTQVILLFSQSSFISIVASCLTSVTVHSLFASFLIINFSPKTVVHRTVLINCVTRYLPWDGTFTRFHLLIRISLALVDLKHNCRQSHTYKYCVPK